MGDALVDAVRAGLRDVADPAQAQGMQAYMKSSMPYLGVRVPVVRTVARAAAAARPPIDLADLASSALVLWDEATHREERYAATGLTALPLALGEPSLVPLHEHMVVTGAWWDHVDEVAHRIAALLDAHPVTTAATVRAWSTSDDLWLRRVAIISQLGRRDRVDQRLLADVIEPNVEDRSFFVRKAIGWALREHARRDPRWVRTFVDDHPALSGLSRREALKHVG